MKTARTQQGLTIWGWLVIALMAGFLVMVGLKLMPVYFENMSVKSSLESLKQQEDIDQLSQAQIMSLLFKRFNVNQVDSVKRENIKVERLKSGSKLITVSYEVRVPIVSNVSAVVAFENKISEADIAE